MTIGCSGGREHVSRNRELETCGAGTVYCWGRCMNITADTWGGGYKVFGLDEATCEATGSGYAVKCVNEEDEVP